MKHRVKRFTQATLLLFSLLLLVGVLAQQWISNHYLSDAALSQQLEKILKNQLKHAELKNIVIKITPPKLFFSKILKDLLGEKGNKNLVFQVQLSGEYPLSGDNDPALISLQSSVSISNIRTPLQVESQGQWKIVLPKSNVSKFFPEAFTGQYQAGVQLHKNYEPVLPIRAQIQIPEIHFSNENTEALVSGIEIEAAISEQSQGKVKWKSFEFMTGSLYRDLGILIPKQWSWEQNPKQIKFSGNHWKLQIPIPFNWDDFETEITNIDVHSWIADQLPVGMQLQGTAQIKKKAKKAIFFDLKKILFSTGELKTRIQHTEFKLKLEAHSLKPIQLNSSPFVIESRFYKNQTEIHVLGQKFNTDEINNFEKIKERTWTKKIEINPLHLAIAPIQGTFLKIKTDLFLPSQNLNQISDSLCQKNWVSFPITVQSNLKNIELSPDQIQLKGSIEFSLLNGFIKIQPSLIDSPFSRARETHLQLEANRIQLAEFTKFSHFGKIDGILKAYAKKTILRGILPLQTDFKIEIVPDQKSVIVFSSEAMKNFVRLITEEGIQAIPKIAQWFAFGPPSQLLGGYNIDYVGVTLQSEGNSLIMDTLDPPEVKSLGRHYLLKGPRFKIPLDSPMYPVRFDKIGISLFVERIFNQLKGLSRRQETQSQNEDYDETTCKTPEFN